MKRFYLAGSLFMAVFLVLSLAGCPNPSDGGGGGGGGGDDPIPVSGSIDTESLAALTDALGLPEGQAVTLELRTPQGETITRATLNANGTWTANIPPEYKGTEIKLVLVVPTAEGGNRILEGGTVTIGTDGTVGTIPEIIVEVDVYTITKTAAANGSFTVSRETALAGESVRVTGVPDAGYRVKQITVTFSGGSVSVSEGGIFTMPAGNVTVTVEFEPVPGSEPAVVDAFALETLITAPVKGDDPVTTEINTDQYTGTIEWQTDGGAAHSGPFAPSTVYQAVLTLTAQSGYTFTGVAADSFTYTGATAVTNVVDSGIVTITFPETEEEGGDTIVNARNLSDLVTAPVRGALPDTTGINETQYTGTIEWQTENGAAHSSGTVFAASTVYKAVLTLTANTGFTFEGVPANSFTHTGATAGGVTNTANSGVVTITFQATAAAVVDALALDALVTAPVKGEDPVTTGINMDQYTGTVSWQTSDGTPHSGAFAAFTVYQAVLTLTPKTGYTFDGVPANSFTYAGATAANAANSGMVTITFQATAAAVVDALALDALVTAPAWNAVPDTGIDAAQYTGIIAWQTSGGTSHSGPFAASTVYKAVLTLTAKSGYTFTGVAANSFTYTGATAVTNAANSGAVTITFTATEQAEPNTNIPIGSPGVKLYLNGAPLADRGSTSIAVGEGTYTVSIASGTYTGVTWHLNDQEVTAAQNKTSITLSKRKPGTYLVTVEAEPAGGVKNSGAHTFVVETIE